MSKVFFGKYAAWISAMMFFLFLALAPGYSSNLLEKESSTAKVEGLTGIDKNDQDTDESRDLSVVSTYSNLLASYSKGETERRDKTIRILAIGNSFSRDAVEQYLYELAEAEGISVIIGNLYIGGCSLERHLANAKNNSPAYEYCKIENGVMTKHPDVKLADGIADEKWDYISVQQVSGNSGRYETFKESLPGLVDYVKAHATNPKMKLMLHQTWAYAMNSTHQAFPNYDKDQAKMFGAIVDAVTRAADLVNVDFIIPSGTAIQNGRTSCIGDHFNRDGYHLELTYGRFTAACTWFEKIFKKDVTRNSYAPAGVDPYKIEIAKHAAHAAVLNPDKVTVLHRFEHEPADMGMLK